jgi:inosose dehydratase
MIIGCFALVSPFSSLRRQFELIKDLGIQYVDLTDNHDGASLGEEYSFAASFSLDARPDPLKKLTDALGLTITSVCAHANLLDPTSPERFGTAQIIKAIRIAHLLGVKQVITTEGDPKTDFGHRLTASERLFAIREKLYEPILWAEDLDIELLIEPHGILTDTVDGMSRILDALGHEETIGINLDTGNSWLGGGDPLEFVRTFKNRIRHVHWKDMSQEWLSKRGTIYGCGMGTIPLGDGIVGIQAIVDALNEIEFNGPTTLEVAGADNVKRSVERLQQWSNCLKLAPTS